MYCTARIALGSSFLSPASFFTQFCGLSPAQEPLTQEKTTHNHSLLLQRPILRCTDIVTSAIQNPDTEHI